MIVHVATIIVTILAVPTHFICASLYRYYLKIWYAGVVLHAQVATARCSVVPVR